MLLLLGLVTSFPQASEASRTASGLPHTTTTCLPEEAVGTTSPERRAKNRYEGLRGGYLAATRWEGLRRAPNGYQDSVNVYAYGANDPINHRDPTGTVALVIASYSWVSEDGDTLESVAKQIGITELDLELWNADVGPSSLSAGIELKVPRLPRIIAFESAARNIGSALWARKAERSGIGSDQPKCNIFVCEVLEEASAQTTGERWYPKFTYTRYGIRTRTVPELAGRIANTEQSIERTSVAPLEGARVGDIIAYSRGNMRGHAAIFAGDVTVVTPERTYATDRGSYATIGAGAHTVNYRDEAWLRAAGDPAYRDPRIRRVLYSGQADQCQE